MKKLIALLSVAVILLGFAGCKKDGDAKTTYPTNLTPNEIASLEAQKAVMEDKENTLEEIGKTIQGEKVVGVKEFHLKTEYYVAWFNDSGELEHIITHVYFDREEIYENMVSVGDEFGRTFIESDDELLKITYRTEPEEGGYEGFTFDDMVHDFESRNSEVIW